MEIRFRHQEAYDRMRRAKRVLLVAHPKPDGDTLGAATAMLIACNKLGIPATGFCVDKVPSQYSRMTGTESFTCDPAVFADSRHDVVAVFDAGDLRFAGIADLVAAMRPAPTILNFDHHATNEKFGQVDVLDVHASSTAEVVYDFLNFNRIDYDREVATCLLTGILFDTGNFSNAATTVSSMVAASDLIRRGAKLQQVTNWIFRNKTLPSLEMWGSALSRLKHEPVLGVATTAIFLKDLETGGVDDEQVEGISNFVNRFLDVRALLVLKELPEGKVKGSFRSVDATDVSAPAKMLGGGGHKKAAGVTLRGKIVETAQAWRVEREN